YITFTKRERNGVITLVVLILLIAVAPELFPKAVITAAPVKEAGEKNRGDGNPPFAYRDDRYSRRVYSDYRLKPGEEERYPEDKQELAAYGRELRAPAYPFREGITGGYSSRYREREAPGGKAGYRSAYRYNTSDKSSYGNSRYYREQYPRGGIKGGKNYYERDNGPSWLAAVHTFKRSGQAHILPADSGLKGNLKNHSFRKTAIININKADTADFIALPGIGAKLAARIVLFRSKLGGFNRIEQVREIYGLPDSTYSAIARWLTCNPGEVEKIDINDAPWDKLSAHPYLRGNIASAILSYRKQHGLFQSLADLDKIQSLQPSDLEKIRPYLSVKDSGVR
ncbi:MAG: helix-hairpin-helix domain-containing protein, partial [Flavitalea sp.]